MREVTATEFNAATCNHYSKEYCHYSKFQEVEYRTGSKLLGKKITEYARKNSTKVKTVTYFIP